MANRCHIDVEQVDVRFGNSPPILQSIEWTCPPGQFLALIGPSGCGKSTLLRCIAGIQPLSAGAVSFRSPQGGLPRVAFVFQDPTLLPWRTVLENISLPLELAGKRRDERLAAATDALRRIGLADSDGHKFPPMLSGGMRMRVSLARALVTDPDILLLDEPFAALDELARQQLHEELLRLWHEQRWTAIFVTHQVTEATFLSERILFMSRNPGRIVADCSIVGPSQREQSWRTSSEFMQQAAKMAECLREVSAS